jgi:hypothetical protein
VIGLRVFTAFNLYINFCLVRKRFLSRSFAAYSIMIRIVNNNKSQLNLNEFLCYCYINRNNFTFKVPAAGEESIRDLRFGRS